MMPSRIKPGSVDQAGVLHRRVDLLGRRPLDRRYSGERTVFSILPSRDRAYFAPATPGSMKIALCSGISRSCRSSALSLSLASVASWNSAQRRGATLEVTEMQPTPPCALKPSADRVLARKLDEILAAGHALLGNALDLAGRILDADDVLEIVRQPPHRLRRSCRSPSAAGML